MEVLVHVVVSAGCFPLASSRTILTLGLFLIVINAAMLKLAAAIVKGFDIRVLRPPHLAAYC